MQIDFAMNIYAACEAFGGAGEEMWGSAWDARAASRPFSPGIIIGIFIISAWPWCWRGGVFLVPWGGGRTGPAADLECAEHP